MKENKTDRLQDLHNKGERDRSEGANNYKPPHSLGDEITTTFLSFIPHEREEHQNIVEENEAYNKGWRNTDKQR